jgi:hypothetical protein
MENEPLSDMPEPGLATEHIVPQVLELLHNAMHNLLDNSQMALLMSSFGEQILAPQSLTDCVPGFLRHNTCPSDYPCALQIREMRPKVIDAIASRIVLSPEVADMWQSMKGAIDRSIVEEIESVEQRQWLRFDAFEKHLLQSPQECIGHVIGAVVCGNVTGMERLLKAVGTLIQFGNTEFLKEWNQQEQFIDDQEAKKQMRTWLGLNKEHE